MFTLRREIWQNNECVSQNVRVTTIKEAYEHLNKEWDNMRDMTRQDGCSFATRQDENAIFVDYKGEGGDKTISYELINSDRLEYVPLDLSQIKPLGPEAQIGTGRNGISDIPEKTDDKQLGDD